MKLAHISDTHLGYLAYSRTAEGRLNQREVDVCRTFAKCLESILDRDPDLVIHSGDLFHVVRPSNYALIYAYRTISEFQRKRKGRPFVVIGGNHDTPQSVDSTNILSLIEQIDGVYVQAGLAKTLELPEASVLCVPHRSIESGEAISWAPPTGSKPAIAALHGLVDRTGLEKYNLELESTRYGEWAYVALGDWHVHQRYAPNVCYAGSTDFTSTNIWEEAPFPKGWVWFDTSVGELELVRMPTRPVIDLPPIDAEHMAPDDLADALCGQANWTCPELPIVRQRVINVGQATRRELPMQVVRSIESRTVHYRLVLQAVPTVVPGLPQSPQTANLETCWERHIDALPISAAIDKPSLKQLGLDLLREVAEHEADSPEA